MKKQVVFAALLMAAGAEAHEVDRPLRPLTGPSRAGSLSIESTGQKGLPFNLELDFTGYSAFDSGDLDGSAVLEMNLPLKGLHFLGTRQAAIFGISAGAKGVQNDSWDRAGQVYAGYAFGFGAEVPDTGGAKSFQLAAYGALNVDNGAGGQVKLKGKWLQKHWSFKAAFAPTFSADGTGALAELEPGIGTNVSSGLRLSASIPIDWQKKPGTKAETDVGASLTAEIGLGSTGHSVITQFLYSVDTGALSNGRVGLMVGYQF